MLCIFVMYIYFVKNLFHAFSFSHLLIFLSSILDLKLSCNVILDNLRLKYVECTIMYLKNKFNFSIMPLEFKLVNTLLHIGLY